MCACVRVCVYGNVDGISTPQNDGNVNTPTQAGQERVKHHEGSTEAHL